MLRVISTRLLADQTVQQGSAPYLMLNIAGRHDNGVMASKSGKAPLA